jgi:hypothetical protein
MWLKIRIRLKRSSSDRIWIRNTATGKAVQKQFWNGSGSTAEVWFLSVDKNHCCKAETAKEPHHFAATVEPYHIALWQLLRRNENWN